MIISGKIRFFSLPLLASVLALSYTTPTLAAPQPTVSTTTNPSSNSDFSIQISPSPLVTTLKPGKTSELEVLVRNSGSATEYLKIEPRSFKISDVNEEITLDDTVPPEVSSWLTFQPATFSVEPGQIFSEKVKVAIPESAGFSYSFALVISRQKNPIPQPGARQINGSIALFTLINIDKPGATRKLDLTKFTVSKRVYEYLPAEISLQFHNSGNTFVQPYGNIFIQRHSNDKTAISTLAVNEKKGYILPGNSRTLNTDWSEGFPAYMATVANNGATEKRLVWNWDKISNLRIGKYTAKVVAVYNDGSRDIPIEGEVSFWVIPWKILSIITVVLIIVVIGLASFLRLVFKLPRRTKRTISNTKKDIH